MSTLTGKDLNLVKPALTDDHKVTIGTDLPANFQKIDDEFTRHQAETVQDEGGVHGLVYEEGTWVPKISNVAQTGNNTYAKQEGRYTRIGNLVTLEFDVQISNKDAALSGMVCITGMPFISAQLKTVVAPLWYSGVNLGEGYTTCQFVYGTSNAFATLYKMHQTTPAYVDYANITDTTRFMGTITYRL